MFHLRAAANDQITLSHKQLIVSNNFIFAKNSVSFEELYTYILILIKIFIQAKNSFIAVFLLP